MKKYPRKRRTMNNEQKERFEKSRFYIAFSFSFNFETSQTRCFIIYGTFFFFCLHNAFTYIYLCTAVTKERVNHWAISEASPLNSYFIINHFKNLKNYGKSWFLAPWRPR